MFGAAGRVANADLFDPGPVTALFTGHTKAYAGSETTALRAIDSNQSTIVAVGGVNGASATNIVKYSTDDGSTWNNGTITAGKPLEFVKYANGLWVAAGDFGGFGGTQDAHIFTSTDGITWTARLNTGTIGDQVYDLQYSTVHGLWMMTINRNDTPYVYTSANGTTNWTLRTLPVVPNVNGDYAYNIVDNPSDGVCFIIGEGFDGAFSTVVLMWKTTNGTTWTGPTDIEGLVVGESMYQMRYNAKQNLFNCYVGAEDLAKYSVNASGYPQTGTRVVIDTTSQGGGSQVLNFNLAGGLLLNHNSTWGLAVSDGNTTYQRYPVQRASGRPLGSVQHKDQYFSAGFDTISSRAVIYKWVLDERKIITEGTGNLSRVGFSDNNGNGEGIFGSINDNTYKTTTIAGIYFYPAVGVPDELYVVLDGIHTEDFLCTATIQDVAFGETLFVENMSAFFFFTLSGRSYWVWDVVTKPTSWDGIGTVTALLLDGDTVI